MTETTKTTKAILVLLALGVLGFFYFLALKSNEVRIQEEQHITTVYSEYKNNIDTCRQQAKENQKDAQYIKKNCIDALNASLLGEWPKSWQRSDLLIKK